MIVEPMTDTDVDRLRATANAKWIDRGGMWMRPIDVLDLIARLDAERTRADAAEAERDAAVARAMPEPVLVQTAAEVGALTVGAYRLAPPWRPRGKWILGRRHPPGTWTLLIDMGASGVMDDHIVGSWVQRLPDLPTPSAAQEAANG